MFKQSGADDAQRTALIKGPGCTELSQTLLLQTVQSDPTRLWLLFWLAGTPQNICMHPGWKEKGLGCTLSFSMNHQYFKYYNIQKRGLRRKSKVCTLDTQIKWSVDGVISIELKIDFLISSCKHDQFYICLNA